MDVEKNNKMGETGTWRGGWALSQLRFYVCHQHLLYFSTTCYNFIRSMPYSAPFQVTRTLNFEVHDFPVLYAPWKQEGR